MYLSRLREVKYPIYHSPGSIDPDDIVTSCIKWVKTSWTYSRSNVELFWALDPDLDSMTHSSICINYKTLSINKMQILYFYYQVNVLQCRGIYNKKY